MAPWNATGRCTVLDDERAVQVLHDGAWVDGWVMAQRRDPDGWWACVRYTVGVGMQYRHWRPAAELRRPDVKADTIPTT